MMTDALMISVSGVRGVVGRGLTPELVVRFAAAFGAWAGRHGRRPVVVLGRDARVSGPMLADAAAAGLMGVGADVVDVGVVPTPTVQLEVERLGAQGGVVITASHNPIEWNALKFVGPDGIFLDATDGGDVRRRAEGGDLPWAPWNDIGTRRESGEALEHHLGRVLENVAGLDLIRRRGFHVVLDCVRGAGGVVMPSLLESLGCRVTGINLAPDGRFPRPPEPVPEHLGELGAAVAATGADLGIAVDPDVDRLALVDERGTPIGEDYTLAFAVRAVLGGEGRHGAPAPVVCNLSTSLVVDDAARSAGAEVVRVPVGEAHVARAMLTHRAEIGGEGNGGVMYAAVHRGRDALVAAALALELLAREGRSVGELVRAHPRYVIVKVKVARSADLGPVYEALVERFGDAQADQQDGLRLAWRDRWVHVRPSGTEPVVRLIAEAPDRARAEALVAACRAEVERRGSVACAES